MKKTQRIFLEILLIFFNLFFIKIYFNNKSFGATNQSISDGIYIIKSFNSNYVIGIEKSKLTDCANVELQKQNNSDSQKFQVNYLGNGYYSITSFNSKKSMDVYWGRKTNGTNIQQYSKNDGDNQKWLIKDAGNGYYNIISKCNNLFVDITENKYEQGTNIEMWQGNNGNNQKFKFEKTDSTIAHTKTIEEGTYIIRSAVNSNYVLDIAEGSTKNCANLEIYNNNANYNQKFKVKLLDNNYYSIESIASKKVLDVEGNSKKAGTNVEQYESNNQDNQKWIIKSLGNGKYNIISKSSGLYLDIYNSEIRNCSNVIVWNGNGGTNQQFIFEKAIVGEKTIEDGLYVISSSGNKNFALDVTGPSKNNVANIELWNKNNGLNQKYNVSYIGNGQYKIISVYSNKSLDVEGNIKKQGANIDQYDFNNTINQKWIIQKSTNDTYKIITENGYFCIDVTGAIYKNGTNIAIWSDNGGNNQKFNFEKVSYYAKIDSLNTSKYKGYKDKLVALSKKYQNWKFEFLYTGINFRDAVSGEASNVRRNLVPTSYEGEWIIGTELYDSGWYSASEKAIAYYMDPRNFLDEENIFQFLDVNSYTHNSCTLDGIKLKTNGTYLSGYENDINNACLNKNVNPYYVISRLIQEQGTKGGSTWKMTDEKGKLYYNPFNIGANGDGTNTIISNALARAKSEGWDTMQKAIEGGIYFLKANWLENYQNTLYQNRFDIDKTNGSALYVHQYMQNLMGAYSEAKILKSMYSNTGKMNSEFKFIIPLYENMDAENAPLPSSKVESTIINVKTTKTKVNMRKESNTNSEILKTFEKEGEILLSIQRGINGNWQKVVTTDGTVGYISGDLLTQIDDVIKCKYTAYIKTNDGDGCYARYAPTKAENHINPAYSDGTTVTVIDDSTYKNITGYDWYRCVLANGMQVFFPSAYLKK